jgi:hypothetical protein
MQNTYLTLNSDNVAEVVVARQCCKNIFYAVTHSVATVEIASREGYPKWVIAGIVVDCTVSTLLFAYLNFAWFCNPKKKNKPVL